MLVLKLLLTPLFIAAVTLAGRPIGYCYCFCSGFIGGVFCAGGVIVGIEEVWGG